MSATPRPWSWFADVRKDGVKVARIGGGTPTDDLGSALKHDDADLIVTAVNEHDALVAKVAEVRALHRPVDVEPSETICAECSPLHGEGVKAFYLPTVEWPCSTIAILNGEPTT